jgi:hypothetical protein
MNLQGILLGVISLLIGLGSASVQAGKTWEGLAMIVVGLVGVWVREYLKPEIV